MDATVLCIRKLYFLVVLVCLQLPTVARTDSGFFNVALMKPVSVEPSGATCGSTGSKTFCKSMTDPQSALSCREETCSMWCPHTNQLGHSESLFGNVQSADWGDCVVRDSLQIPPETSFVNSVHFQGSSQGVDPCFLDLDPTWVVSQLRLMSRWDATLSLWIYPQMNSSESGTIIHIVDSDDVSVLHVTLVDGTQLHMSTGDITETAVQWKLKPYTWQHLTLQVHDPFLAVFVDGDFVSPAIYDIPYERPAGTDRIRIGQSFREEDTFRGYMQDFRMYMKSASNREIQEIKTGSLPPLRLQTECRCPQEFPRLKSTDETYCSQNEGSGREISEKYRLNDKSHPTEFVNDGKADDTFWLSQPETEETNIIIDFEDVYEVRHVEIRFYSPFPESVTVERMRSPGGVWEPWQYYSHDCQQLSMDAGAILTSPDDVNCQYLIPPNTDPPYSRGLVKLDLLAGRSGQNGGVLTSSLRQFLLASGVRIILRGYPFAADARHRYHGIYEIHVNGTCDCHGHGTGCSQGDSSYQCSCSPASFTVGERCDQCDNNTYSNPLSDPYSPDLCLPCTCNTNGTITGNEFCDGTSGQCPCKSRAAGRLCDSCDPGFFNLTPENPDGCDPCLCQTDGTINGTDHCDVTSGQCACKDNVAGVMCDQCKEGFYNLDGSSTEGCADCECNTNGTLGGLGGCDDATGQCTCKTNVTGRACDQCEPDTYDLSNMDGCKPCGCDVTGSRGASCDMASGQCSCKVNVVGQQCTECKAGYFALDAADYSQNGCTHQCSCDPDGNAGGANSCDNIGGQCSCKPNVSGRKCDQCKSSTYAFGRDQQDGCVSCGCDVSGTVAGDVNCDAISGQCACKANVRLRRCSECKFGYYGFSADITEGCTSCDCYPGGTVENGTCDATTGQCDCIPGAGEVAKGGRHCNAYISSFVPTYGPISGGTRVHLKGGYLSSTGSATLRLGDIDCIVDQANSNATDTVCTTPSLIVLGMEDLLNKPLDATLTPDGGVLLALDETFVFKEDPIITSVNPLKTFLKGGIVLTVKGEHLDSVFMPIMQVHMVQTRDDGSIYRDTFESICEVQSGEVMLCKTPEISMPDDLVRKRRDVIDDIISPGRAKRQSEAGEEEDGESLNGDDLEFYLGFIFDGVEIYRNMSDTDPDMGILSVYLDPEFEPFEEEVRLFRTYWPYNDDTITILGKRLNHGCTHVDYTITIGIESCSDMGLQSTQVECRPPEDLPEVSGSGHKDGAPGVVIYVGNIIFVPGFLKYETSIWDNDKFRYGLIGGILGLLLLIVLLVLLCVLCFRQRRRRKNKMPPEVMEAEEEAKSVRSIVTREDKPKGNVYISAYESGDSAYLNPQALIGPDLLDVLPEDLRLRVRETLIDYRRMVVGKLIGEGHFGRVHIGRLSDEYHSCQVPVAIKTLREHNVTLREIIQFLEEATIMEEFKHENILSLMGVVLENNRAYVILPYMENGDLKTFITNEDNILTVGELIQFGYYVSCGMGYLEDQKFVHRDLACRNVMVNKDLMVKVADFGLSRDIYENDYYKESELKRPLPVKWMAVESLEKAVFTTKSDVWSYGVLVWELLTRGCTPYPDVDPFDMKAYLLCGNRMDRPDYAPDEIYSMMLECWKDEPGKRPSFHDIRARLADFLDMSMTKTLMRDRQSQKVPTNRGNSYLQLLA